MPDRLPPLNSLRTFEVAARHLSFKDAAEELSVTPTAVSHQIRGLEEFLGVELFRRLTRALELTSEGEAMLPKVREGMDCFAAAVSEVRSMKPGARLRVVAPPSFAQRWLMPRLWRFNEREPNVELYLRGSIKAIDSSSQLSTQHSDDAEHRRGRNRDVPQLWIRYGRGQYIGVRTDHLFEPEYTAVCSPALLQRRIPLNKPEDLRHFALIHDETIPDRALRPRWEAWLAAAGVHGVRVAGPHFSNSGLAISAAIDGLGVALLAKQIVEGEIATGRLVAPFDISIRCGFSYYIVSPENVADTPQVVSFRDWLIEEAGESS
ncbi:MAG: transcriptional regulator GcvA [Zoogloeaceae bacterium]|nr:transcriptional regulator GcvA [Zoogloeaceae bacterium]